MKKDLKPQPYEPDWRSHPGDTIRELFVCKVLGSTEDDTEDDWKMRNQIEEIMAGRGSITPEIAKVLSDTFEIPESFFLNRQKNYDRPIPFFEEVKEVFENMDIWCIWEFKKDAIGEWGREIVDYFSIEEEALKEEKILLENERIVCVKKERVKY